MARLQSADLYRSYYTESSYSDSPKLYYGKRKTRVTSVWDITQVEEYPSFGSSDVKFSSREINLTKIDFREAKVSLSASRSISTGTTDAIIKTGGKDDVFRSGQSIQFWYGTRVETGGGNDSLIINNTAQSVDDYLGDILLVAGTLDMGVDNDLISIRVYNQNTLFGSNDPGIEIREGYYSEQGLLTMGEGDDRIVVDAPGNSSYSSSALSVSADCTLDMGLGNDTIDLITGGMKIHGAVNMGEGDDVFLVRSLQGKNGAWVQRGEYPLDPIVDGGDGLDLLGIPDGFYSITIDQEGWRITNGIGAGWELSVDITMKSFEFVSGSTGQQPVALQVGKLDVSSGIATYIF
jgi:hypothetical protein